MLCHYLDAFLLGHQHIHLPGIDKQSTDLVQFFFDQGTLKFLKAGIHPVAIDLNPEIQVLKDQGNSPDPAVPPEVICSAPFE
jgi:hypothetical protein